MMRENVSKKGTGMMPNTLYKWLLKATYHNSLTENSLFYIIKFNN